MQLIRAFEEQVRSLYSGGAIPGLVHLCAGQEAVAVGVCCLLGADDMIASNHRGHGHCLAKGADVARLMAEVMGRRTGYGLGRSGTLHVFDAANGNLGTTGIVGGGIPLAAGAALSAKRNGRGQVAAAFFGDGALNQGLMFEVMNMAAIWKLPALFICENNGFGERDEEILRNAGEKKHGDEHDADAQRRYECRHRDLLRSIKDRLHRLLAHRQVPVDVFDFHGRVVHKDSDRQRQPAQGHDVDRLA